jgi:hypothetical protein
MMPLANDFALRFSLDQLERALHKLGAPEGDVQAFQQSIVDSAIGKKKAKLETERADAATERADREAKEKEAATERADAQTERADKEAEGRKTEAFKGALQTYRALCATMLNALDSDVRAKSVERASASSSKKRGRSESNSNRPDGAGSEDPNNANADDQNGQNDVGTSSAAPSNVVSTSATQSSERATSSTRLLGSSPNVEHTVKALAGDLGVDLGQLKEDVEVEELASRLMKSKVVFRPVGATRSSSSGTGRKPLGEELDELMCRYARGTVDEVQVVHPICHHVVWLAWLHLCKSDALEVGGSDPVEFPKVNSAWARTSFRSAASHEGLAGLDGVGPPVLFLERTELVIHDGDESQGDQVLQNPDLCPEDDLAKRARVALVDAKGTDEDLITAAGPWCSGSRQSSERRVDAALLSWLPRKKRIPRCAMQSALLSFEWKGRLFSERMYQKDRVDNFEATVRSEIYSCSASNDALHEVRRDAALRLARTDFLSPVPYHFFVISDGVYWIFGVIQYEHGKLEFGKWSVRRYDDAAGVFADLLNIMLVSTLVPSYLPVAVQATPLGPMGHNFHIE